MLSEVADSLQDDAYALLMESQIECRILLGARTGAYLLTPSQRSHSITDFNVCRCKCRRWVRGAWFTQCTETSGADILGKIFSVACILNIEYRYNWGVKIQRAQLYVVLTKSLCAIKFEFENVKYNWPARYFALQHFNCVRSMLRSCRIDLLNI